MLSESIDVEFRYTPGEYSRAVRRHFRSAFNIRRDIVVAIIGCGIGFDILYHGKRNLTVLPRRVLSTVDADQRFEGLLRRKIAERPSHGD